MSATQNIYAVLGLYDEEGFVFCTRNGTAFLLRNMRRNFGRVALGTVGRG